MSTIPFVCLQNAGRSQISEGLFSRVADGRHGALFAGTSPGDNIRPEVVEVMRELGIDLDDRQRQLLTRELAEQAGIIVTMGCGDQCPHVPGKKYIDCDLPDPRRAPSRASPEIRPGEPARIRA